MDCSSFDEKCLDQSNRVRQKFAASMKYVLKDRFKLLTTLFRPNNDFRKRTENLLCNKVKYFPLGREVQSFLWLNISQRALRELFANHYDDVAFLPNKIALEKSKEFFAKYRNFTVPTYTSDCKNRVRALNISRVPGILASFLVAKNNGKELKPMGTLIRRKLRRWDLTSKPFIRIFNLLDEKMNMSSSLSLMNYITQYRYPKYSYEKMVDSGDFKTSKALDAVSGQLYQFDNSAKELNIYRSIAISLANEMGLDESVILKRGVSYPMTTLTQCNHFSNEMSECFPFQMTYSTHGLAFAMNMANWKDVFKQQTPFFNTLKQRQPMSLSAKDLITLHFVAPQG